MKDSKEKKGQKVQKSDANTLSFKFSFKNPTDIDKVLNDAIVVYTREHQLSASQSTCCGASKGRKK